MFIHYLRLALATIYERGMHRVLSIRSSSIPPECFSNNIDLPHSYNPCLSHHHIPMPVLSPHSEHCLNHIMSVQICGLIFHASADLASRFSPFKCIFLMYVLCVARFLGVYMCDGTMSKNIDYALAKQTSSFALWG